MLVLGEVKSHEWCNSTHNMESLPGRNSGGSHGAHEPLKNVYHGSQVPVHGAPAACTLRWSLTAMPVSTVWSSTRTCTMSYYVCVYVHIMYVYYMYMHELNQYIA